MSKIESLTEDQWKEMRSFREEALLMGRSVEPSDRKTTEIVISSFYRKIEKPQPIFWWCDSPFQAQIVINILKSNKLVGANLWANLWDNLWDNLGANLWAHLEANLRANLEANLRDNLRANLGANLWANLGANLRANLRANLGDNLGAHLGANLWANLGANLRANLRDNLGANLWANLGDNLGAHLEANLRANLEANLRDNLRDNLRVNLWANLGARGVEFQPMYLAGQYDLFWSSYYLFMTKIGIKYTEAEMERLKEWDLLGRSAAFWFPFEGVCFICDRPSALRLDQQGRLHSDESVAIEYRDGYSVSAVHGQIVPSWIISSPGLITIEKIKAEKNAEVRRIMIDRFGRMKYLRETNAKLIHADVWHGLPRGLFEDADDNRYLYGSDNSTGRIYAMPVSSECNTCTEAHENICGFSEELLTHQS